MTIQLSYPVNGPITQGFGENPDFYKQWGYPGHNGIDFGIPNGTPVLAAAKGVVDKVSFEDGGYGNYVKLRHTDGLTTFYTYYAHLMQANVAAGQNVEAGAVVGHSNNTGASTGPHLHFGLRIMDQNPAYKGYVDPKPYFVSVGSPTTNAAGSVDLPSIQFVVLTDQLNIRNGPGVNYSIVGQLKKDSVVTASRLYSEGAWIEFEPGRWCAVTFGGIQNLKVK